ncbi:hypothetical protein [Cohnella fermenti]|uniref:Uncharacterized protein n=1 Tax=Cohnella fermenti TaxID=2565925 RepID=A0A4S4C3M0_9BACL|nr:hypothetical protein [Cohnella fermenti]THF82103.1 hypothetical protein E6C55_06870 [Cohnella fermenti]
MKNLSNLKSIGFILIASIMLIAGCGETKSNTINSEDASKAQSASNTGSADEEAKGIVMQVVDAVVYPEDGSPAPIVFELSMQNKGDLTVDVNNLKFYLVTVNGEMIETALSSRNSKSRYLLPDGTTNFKAAFVVDDPGTVGGIVFGDQNLDIFVKLSASEFPALRTSGQELIQEPQNQGVDTQPVPEPTEEVAPEKAPTTNSKAQTAVDAIKIVEDLDPGNFTATHDFPEYDITTVDGAHYYYISYTSAEGMGGDVFVRKGTSEVYGWTMGTEDNPDAPFPDFSNQIQ